MTLKWRRILTMYCMYCSLLKANQNKSFHLKACAPPAVTASDAMTISRILKEVIVLRHSIFHLITDRIFKSET